MKKLLSTVVLLLLTVSITTSAFAQKQKSRDELLKEISTLSNTKKPEDTEKAYQLGKEFLTRFAKDKEVEKIKKFVKSYQKFSFFKASEDKKFAEFFAIGKEILTEEPENSEITLNLGYGSYDAILKNNDRSFGDDGVKYAKLTLELLEKGSFPPSFAPFANKEEAIAWMYYVVGYFNLEKDIKVSAASMYKATLYESQIKKTSQPYYVMALYYEKQFEDLTKASAGADKTTPIIEQMMDAYARAYKIGVTEKHPATEEWKSRLAQVYKFHKKTDAGFEPFINYIVTTPLKDPANY